MHRTCVKCGHEHRAATGGDAEACPACGAIYSKARPRVVPAGQPVAYAAASTGGALGGEEPAAAPLNLRRAVVMGLVAAGLAWTAWTKGGRDMVMPPPVPIPAADSAARTSPAAAPAAAAARVALPGSSGQAGPLTAPAKATPLLQLYRRWIDAEKLAGATSRIALAGPVGTLQQLQREAESLAVPECLAAPKAALVDLTAKSTDAFLKFMQKDELGSVLYQQIERAKAVQALEQALTSAPC